MPVLLALAATVALLPATTRLTVATGNDDWIDRAGQAWHAQQWAEERFGTADGFVVGVFGHDVLSREVLAWIADLRTRIGNLDGVSAVHDLTNAEDVQIDSLGPAPIPLVPSTTVALSAAARQHILNHPLYQHLLIAATGEATAVVVDLKPGLTDAITLSLKRALDVALISPPPPVGYDTVVGGLPAQKQAINQAVVADQHLTVPISITIHACLMMLILRSAILVIIPLASIATTLVWTYAGVALSGQPLDAILGLLPPLVMGIAVASALHLVFAYVRSRDADSSDPIRDALRQTSLPLLLCVLTTSAGILGLGWGPVAAVRHFAPYAAIGIAFAAVTPLLWLWALSPWITSHHAAKVIAGPFGRSMGIHLSRLAQVCRARSWWVIGAAIALAAVSGAALTRVHADADFLHALPEHNEVRLAHERLDRDLTGVLAMDLLIDASHKPGIADLTALTQVKQAMVGDATIASWLSLADVVDYVATQGAAAGSVVDRAQLVDDLSLGAPSVWNRFVGRGIDQPASPKALSTTMHIMIRQRDASVASNAAAARKAVTAAQTAFPGAQVVAASGCLLLDETSQRMIPATIRSTLLPLPCIAMLIMIAMRSLRLAVLALAMAGLPLLITYAVLLPMGWPVDIGVSMIACIALGMIVDDAVRMSIALGRQGAAGPDASTSVGPVLVGGCLAMAGSFIACLAGQFAYTRHFGVLLAVAFLVALVVNITATPALFTCLCSPRRAPETP